jgi:hypothetical protein
LLVLPAPGTLDQTHQKTNSRIRSCSGFRRRSIPQRRQRFRNRVARHYSGTCGSRGCATECPSESV